MTGGSGKRTAVPLPRDPAMTEVALLPEKRVVELDRAVERALRSSLKAALNDLELVGETLVCSHVAFEKSAGFCRLCGCHNCSLAFPHFSGSEEPLNDHEKSFLDHFQKSRHVDQGRLTSCDGHDILSELAVDFRHLWKSISNVNQSVHI